MARNYAVKFKTLFKICLFYEKLWIASKMLTKGRILFWTADFFQPKNSLKLCQCLPCLFTATKYMQFKLFLSGWCFPYFITEISLNEKYLLWAAKFGKTLSSKFCLRTASSYQITQWKGTGSIYPSVLVLRVHIANLKRLFNFYPLFSTDIKKLLSLTKILTSSHKFVFDCLQVCSGRAVVCQRDHTLSSELVSTSQRGS